MAKSNSTAAKNRQTSAELSEIFEQLSPRSRQVIRNLLRAMTDDAAYLTVAKRRRIVKLALENKHAEVDALCGAEVSHVN